ncbi:hypothetical protein VMCG_07717 [Cytospora schulzeri]|uniref:Mcm2 3 5 family protein n=1 Tax=Cytospora schulzeri TaxID=448051 RepID=A0A423VZ14_9PEZI|nr:hypothetical protein VMCG_07717 [Valsa malicola]
MDPHDQRPDKAKDEGHHDPDPSQSHPDRRINMPPGLGISVPRQIYGRSGSGHQGPTGIAAPVAGSSSQAYDPQLPSPPAPAGQGHSRNSSEIWSPQLSGRTLGPFSPVNGGGGGGPAGSPPARDLRGSIYSAWDMGSAAAAYAPLDDEKGMGGNDDDAISLDSLQMHDDGHRHFGEIHTGAHEVGEEEGDYDTFKRQHGDHTHPPLEDVRIRRRSWLSIWLLIMCVYSTILSGIWLGVAIAQPRWGHKISSDGSLSLSSANVLTAIFAKTIEMSFATVFVAFVGQVLTRRAIGTSEGMTMAEMTMRTWITQPGNLLANGYTLRYTGHTLLGILTLIATMVAMLYTTASDTMVRPKLRFNGWENRELKGYVLASYANPVHVMNTCATPITNALDSKSAGESCLAVQYSAYRNLLSFMSAWRDISYRGNAASHNIVDRPHAQAMLYDNITMYGSWIEAQFSDPSASFDTHQRVINNISMALPHPGVYMAATNDENDILQPSDLDGLGAYNISASVISPAVNVLCVNMDAAELAPLVYTTWPRANTTSNANPPYQATGWDGWEGDVPPASGEDEWLNATAVDDVFRWGKKYDRRPPVFQLYPTDDNIITNTTVLGTNTAQSDAIYILGKSRMMDDYTLCEMRSWPAIQCSTQFDNSGQTGMSLSARCAQSEDYYPETADGDTADPDAYVHYMEPGEIAASPDWKNMVDTWRLAINLDGGVSNDNASNARLLTELALTRPLLNDTLPSMAEALAVLVSSTIVTGSVDSPFIHYWDYDWPNMTENTLPSPGALATFHARVRTQEYASWHSSPWQGIFYLVLAFAFLLNLLCLAYLCRVGLVKDFLEPTNLFALATARSGAAAAAAAATGAESPGKTPRTDKERKRESRTNLAVPYRLAYKEDAEYYYFEEAVDEDDGGVKATGIEVGEEAAGGKRNSYRRLSSKMGLI